MENFSVKDKTVENLIPNIYKNDGNSRKCIISKRVDDFLRGQGAKDSRIRVKERYTLTAQITRAVVSIP
jgi:hypothetical protein